MPLPDIVRDSISGFVGGASCTYVGMPFDTIKVRLQTTPSHIFQNPLSAAIITIREEGVRALWKGSVPALTAALTENLVVFAANGIIRRTAIQMMPNNKSNSGGSDGSATTVKEDDGSYLGFWRESMIGGASGFCSATAICPAEVLKCRLQSNRSSTTMLQCAIDLWKMEGISGFYRGLPALWLRDVPFYIAFFTTYTTYIDAAVSYHNVRDKSELSQLHFIMGGGIAGASSWACVFPVDVIKSRMQVGTIDASLSLLQAAKELLRRESVRQLMRGWLPAILRGFPANGALLLGVETTQRLLEHTE